MNELTRLCKSLLLISLLLVGFTVSGKTREPQYDPLTLQDYIDINCKRKCVDQEALLKAVHNAAKSHSLDFMKLIAIIKVESSFRIRAKNDTSVGLAQVNLTFHKKSFKKDYYDVDDNVLVGAGVYARCKKKYPGDELNPLRCYNGEKSKNFRYANKVMKAYRDIVKLIDLKRDIEIDNVQRISSLVNNPIKD